MRKLARALIFFASLFAQTALFANHGNPILLLGSAALLFPRLALGLSGFETGVAVMPLVKGSRNDTEAKPRGRIRNTHKLLLTAAVIMSFFLITSSLVTTLLIPASEFQAGGAANGRALAYLTHRYLGDGFGTLYDLSTISILWFAGAAVFQACEHAQGWSYFESVYFTYTVLLTVSYGDLTPESNAGQSFFVFFTLLGD